MTITCTSAFSFALACLFFWPSGANAEAKGPRPENAIESIAVHRSEHNLLITFASSPSLGENISFYSRKGDAPERIVAEIDITLKHAAESGGAATPPRR